MQSEFFDKNKRATVYNNIYVYKIISLVILAILTIILVVMFFRDQAVVDGIIASPTPPIFYVMLITLILFTFSVIFDFYILHRTASIGRHLNRLAYIDKLTGLPNRYSCDLIFESFSSPEILPDAGFLLLKINNLSSINKDNGHTNGNFLISEFSSILEDVSQDYGHIGRNGGNEFIMIMENCDDVKADMFLMDLTKRIHGYNEMNIGDPLEVAYSRCLNRDEHKEKIAELISLGYKRLKEIPQILS